MRFKQISIIGVGKVGSTIAYTLAISNVVQSLLLVDKNMNKACGEALDITSSLVGSDVTIKASYNYACISNSEIVIICAGKARTTSESREDLFDTNCKVVEKIIEDLNTYNYHGIIIMVTNPVDILTYVANINFKNSFKKVLGTGTLIDSYRLTSVVADELKLPVNVIECYIWGEHGNLSVPMWSLSKIQNKKSDYYLTLKQKELLATKVKNFGAEIIREKGSTCYGISYAVLRIIKAMLGNSDNPIPVSVYLNGQYAIYDLCLSVSCQLNREGIYRILTPSIEDVEQKKLFAISTQMMRDKKIKRR